MVYVVCLHRNTLAITAFISIANKTYYTVLPCISIKTVHSHNHSHSHSHSHM